MKTAKSPKIPKLAKVLVEANSQEELQECLDAFRVLSETRGEQFEDETKVLDAAVFLYKGCVEIYHKNGTWVKCVIVAADPAPWAGG